MFDLFDVFSQSSPKSVFTNGPCIGSLLASAAA